MVVQWRGFPRGVKVNLRWYSVIFGASGGLGWAGRRRRCRWAARL